MKSPMGRDGLVLYLDFDGVLHHSDVYWGAERGFHLRAPERYRLFQHVGLLEELLAPHPIINIVLSTSWVQGPQGSFEDALGQLTPLLQTRVIDCTHWDQDSNPFAVIPRGVQVSRDVERRQPRKWLAIDDDGEGWGAARANLVLSHQYEGIGDKKVFAELKQRLTEMAA